MKKLTSLTLFIQEYQILKEIKFEQYILYNTLLVIHRHGFSCASLAIIFVLNSCSKDNLQSPILSEIQAQECRIKSMRLSYSVGVPEPTYYYEYDSLKNLKKETIDNHPIFYYRKGALIYLAQNDSLSIDTFPTYYLNNINKATRIRVTENSFQIRDYNDEGFLIKWQGEEQRKLEQFPNYNFKISNGNTVEENYHFFQIFNEFTSIKTYTFYEDKFNMIGAQNYGKYFEGRMNRFLIKNEYTDGVKFFDYFYDFDDKQRVIKLTRKSVNGGFDYFYEFTYY